MTLLFKSKVLKNFSVLTLTNILIQVISIVSSIRLARFLQPEGYGIFNLLNVQVGLFSVLAVYGLRLVIIRHIARHKEDSEIVFKISNKIRIVTTIVSILLLFVYNLLSNNSQTTFFLLILVSFLIVFQTLWDSIESIAFGNEKMQASGYINLGATIIWIISIYLVPENHFKVEVLFTIFTINQFLKSVFYYIWLKRSILNELKSSNDNHHINSIFFIKQSNYYFILAVFSALQNQFPVLILSSQSTVDQVGIFNLGYKILSPLQMVLNMALTALYPSFSRLAIENKELFTKRIKSLLNIILIFGIWGCISFTFLSEDIVLLLYGKAYLQSASVILVQCWFTVIYAIFCTTGTVLNSFDKQKTIALLSIIQGILSLPFFYFGAKNGAYGLAMSFVIAGLFNMTYIWMVFKATLKPYLSTMYSVKYLSILLLAILSYFILPTTLNLFYKILIIIIFSVFTLIYILKTLKNSLK